MKQQKTIFEKVKEWFSGSKSTDTIEMSYIPHNQDFSNQEYQNYQQFIKQNCQQFITIGLDESSGTINNTFKGWFVTSANRKIVILLPNLENIQFPEKFNLIIQFMFAYSNPQKAFPKKIDQLFKRIPIQQFTEKNVMILKL